MIELMIVVAIIGILAAVAVPKFSDLITKSKEGKTKANLSAVRSALNIYYANNEGEYPQDSTAGYQSNQQAKFTAVLIPEYLNSLPVCYTPGYHPKVIPATVDYISSLASQDASCDGEWVYVCGKNSSSWGKIFVECYHNDTRNRVWSTY